MMKKCPECGGKIPETESECPICGCIQEPCFDDHASEAEECSRPQEERLHTPKKSSRPFIHFFLEPLLFLLALIVAGVIVIATDFKGARTELRRICMTDSGDGSESDKQYSRITVKHYILVFLDFFDQGGTGESTPVNTDAFSRKRFPDPESVKKKTLHDTQSSQTLMLPPTPPDVKPLDFPQINTAEPSEKGKVFPETVDGKMEKPVKKEVTPAL